MTHSMPNVHNPPEIKIVHLNARSARNRRKFANLTNSLTPNYDVIVLTETWFRYEETVFYNIQGYDRVTFCRDSNENRGGGIAMFIKNHLRIVSVQTGLIKSSETLAVEVHTIPHSIRITAVYRPPDQPISEFIPGLETYLEHHRRHLVLGDINIHFNQVEDRQHLGPLLTSFGFCSLISDPTRITSTCSSTLDHIYTDLPTISCGTFDPEISDHLAIWCALQLCAVTPEEIKVQRTDLRFLRSQLQSLDWSPVYSAIGSEEKFSKLHHLLLQAINDTSTWSSVGPQDLHSEELTDLEKERDHSWSVLQTATRKRKSATAIATLRQNYNKARNRLNNRRIKIKNLLLRQEVNQQVSDGHSIWKIVRRVQRRDKVPAVPKLVVENSSITNPTEVANTLNTFFTSGVAASLPCGAIDKQKIRSRLPSTPSCHFVFRHVSEVHVLCELTNMGNPSAGHDGIKAHIVKHLKDIILSPMTHVINSIINDGVYPSILKGARVVPIHKGGSMSDPGNYRPISVLPVLNKIIEKVLVKQMVHYLESNNLISCNQFGFRKTRGTGHAILQTVEETRFDLDKGKICAAVFYDLRRAFDSVRSEILNLKFAQLGFKEPALKLLRSYFQDRWQFVQLGNKRSDTRPVHIGVAQGSCIGPVAFLCFINDLEKAVRGASIIYADDSTFKYVGDTILQVHTAISRDILELQSWCQDNKIRINPKKTQLVLFRNGRNKPKIPSIEIDNYKITPTDNVKLLGVTLDDKLSGAAHIETLLAKLASVTYSTRYLKNILGPSSCKLLYNSFFLSHLCYGAEYWPVCSQKWLDKLSVSQNRFLRMFRGSSSLEKETHSILDIAELVQYLTLLIVFKNIFNIGPQIIYFERLGTARQTRATHEYILKVRSHRSHHCSKAFGARAVLLWNYLPTELRAIKSLSIFKRSLKAHILARRNC